MDHSAQLAELPPPLRLALAYAPKAALGPTLGLLALDHRLGSLVRSAREPLLAQIKLAWWRDRLGSSPIDWPLGEPLLAILASWGDEARELAGLVDGWEAVLFDGGPAELITGRAQACAALARVLGNSEASDSARRAGQRWGEAEFALVADGEPALPRLPKPLRALAMLVKLTASPEQLRPLQLLAAMRIGLFGR